MLVSEFDYHLPEELIAQEPLPDRAASRMLLVDRAKQSFEDRHFDELPSFLSPGDCLILNISKVIPSRLYGKRENGTGQIEVLLVKQDDRDPRTWEALVRPGRKIRSGEIIHFSERLQAKVISRGEFGWRLVHFLGDVDVLSELDTIGHVPLPPYIRRLDAVEDRSRYQTVYAQNLGSVAAPTAGLHFTPEILASCRKAGAVLSHVTLHVGLGTFAPLRAESLDQVKLHSEHFEIDTSALDTIRSAQRRIAVGTTSVRAIETLYLTGESSGRTDIFISPGFKFRAIDAMLTNFHLPKSSLLMLVCAFGGIELMRAAYAHAVAKKYRFFSYGDCMLII